MSKKVCEHRRNNKVVAMAVIGCQETISGELCYIKMLNPGLYNFVLCIISLDK